MPEKPRKKNAPKAAKAAPGGPPVPDRLTANFEPLAHPEVSILPETAPPLTRPSVLELPPDPEKRGSGGIIEEFQKQARRSKGLRLAGAIAGAAATAAAVTGIIASAVINAERKQRQRKKKKKK